MLAQQELYNVNTIIGPHHKIHEKDSNLNTVGTLFSNRCLWVYTVSVCTNTWQIKHTLPHTYTYKWLLNIEHGLFPWLNSKILSDIPTVLKMFMDIIKWMWMVEEWWKSDVNIMWVDVKKNVHVTWPRFANSWKASSCGPCLDF